MLLSSKTDQQVAAKEGKDSLRDEIKQTLNSFLTKGEIKSVYFTDFLFQ
jgi:flagellar FliL protein